MKAKHGPCVLPPLLVRMKDGDQHYQGIDREKEAHHGRHEEAGESIDREREHLATYIHENDPSGGRFAGVAEYPASRSPAGCGVSDALLNDHPKACVCGGKWRTLLLVSRLSPFQGTATDPARSNDTPTWSMQIALPAE